jgi:hypothetical protein
MRPRVLLIREAAQQMSSSGCCGRIEGDVVNWDKEGCVFPERRAQMEQAGAIYRALRERFGDQIEIQVIDPRNAISWFPLVLTDMWRFQRGWRRCAWSLARLKTSGIVINGELVFNTLPSPSAVVSAVEQVMTEEVAA